MLAALVRFCRVLSLVGGSLFAVVGVLWSLVYLDRLTDEAHVLAALATTYTRRIQSLDAAAAQYFIANQQGDLIFVLASQGNARPDLAALIYKGNLLDRETPVSGMIGALAMARKLDYRQTFDSYRELNDKARAALDFANYQKVKAREKEIVQQGQKLAPELQARLFQIHIAQNANDAAQHRARTIGAVFSILSTLLLLAASLITRREDRGAAPTKEAPDPSG